MTVPQVHTLTQAQEDELRTILETIFQQESKRLARETGFVQRQSPMGGEAFARTMVFGFLDDPHAGYTGLQQVLACQKVLISPQAIAKRMTEPASEFLLALLRKLLTYAIVGERCQLPVLSHFQGVYLQDGTMISLPPALKAHYEGCGGGYAAGEACLRVQVRWDLQQGQLLGPFLQEGRANEQEGEASLAQLPLPIGSLHVTDSKYYNLTRMKEVSGQGSYFLTSYNLTNKFCDQDGIKWDLPTYLSVVCKQGHHQIDVPIRLGWSNLVPCRLIALRKEPTAQRPRGVKIRLKGCRHDVQIGRRKALKGQHGRKHHRVGKAREEISQWIVMVTNVPASLMTAQEARELMGARWQIELLWKLWKQSGLLDIWRSEKPYRVLCEVYAKLIGLVIQHWFTILGCWDDPHRSLVKAALAVQKLALSIVIALTGGMVWTEVFQRNQFMMRRNRLNPRKKRPNTSQRLEAVS